MSGLAGLLAGRHPAGVYRWHTAFDPEQVRHTVELAGWRFGYVDGWRAQGRHELLGAIGEALDLPDHYGRNLDALNDCVGDLTARTVLLWDGWSTLARADGHAFGVVVEILGSAPVLSVLLRGDGPEVEVSSLD